MKISVAVLALLVCVTRAAPQNGQDEALVKADVETPENKEHLEQITDGHVLANTRKVAFSFGSGIQGTYGPFNTDVTMNFNKELINIGNAYSEHTGVFKAPVKGIYHISASVFGNSNVYVEAYLIKNGKHVFGMSESPKGSNMSISRAVNLLLEQGDEIYLRLKAGCQIYDDNQTYNTFSGFLIFPM